MKNIICILLLIFVTGCATTQNRNYTSEPAQAINNSLNEQNRSIDNIKEQNDAIKDRATDIKKSTDDIRKTQDPQTIKEKTDEIDGFATRIQNRTNNIDNQLDDLEKESKLMRESLQSIQKQEEQLRDFENGGIEARNKLYDLIKYMFALGGLIVIGGVALAFFNPKMGAYLAGFGLIITTVATAGTFYLKWLALVGFIIIGVGLIITLAFLIYSFWKARIYQQSHKANVKLVEEIKEELLPEEKEKFFGDNGIAKKIQPEPVQKEIKKLRKTL